MCSVFDNSLSTGLLAATERVCESCPSDTEPESSWQGMAGEEDGMFSIASSVADDRILSMALAAEADGMLPVTDVAEEDGMLSVTDVAEADGMLSVTDVAEADRLVWQVDPDILDAGWSGKVDFCSPVDDADEEVTVKHPSLPCADGGHSLSSNWLGLGALAWCNIVS